MTVPVRSIRTSNLDGLPNERGELQWILALHIRDQQAFFSHFFDGVADAFPADT